MRPIVKNMTHSATHISLKNTQSYGCQTQRAHFSLGQTNGENQKEEREVYVATAREAAANAVGPREHSAAQWCLSHLSELSSSKLHSNETH